MNRIIRMTEPYAPLARRLLPLAALVTLVAIGFQFLFAGVMVFAGELFGVEGRDAHFWFGGVVHALLGLLLALSLVGRYPRPLIAVSGALFLVATAMMALPNDSFGFAPEAQALHPVGAFLVAVLTYVVYDRSRAYERVAAAEPVDASPVATTS